MANHNNTAHQPLNLALLQLAETGCMPIEEWPDSVWPVGEVENLGIGYADGKLTWQDPTPKPLDPKALKQSLSELDLHHFHCIDSTNNFLLEQQNSIHNMVCTAELQIGGRGRRGKAWVSPYARNIAVSLGRRLSLGISQLGGLSLAVGLGVATCLQKLGIANVGLKWPNDVFINHAKATGILVELRQDPAGTEVIIGIGVNIELDASDKRSIDQLATDVRSQGVTEDRTQILIILLLSVIEELERFECEGFASSIERYNKLHLFHQQACKIIQGNNEIAGTVVSVLEDGAISLQSESGIQHFYGGEVSLRKSVD